MIRFDAVSKRIRTGIRLSPLPIKGMESVSHDKRDFEVFETLFQELEKREVAYVHSAADQDVRFMRKHYSGVLIGCGEYTVKSGAKALLDGECDLIAFGRLLVANPNLAELIQNKQEPQQFNSQMIASPPLLPIVPNR